MESFSSSYLHNKSMKGEPLGRLVVTGPKILYKNQEYSSASDALSDYINEFQGKSRQRHVKSIDSEGVLNLLISPPSQDYSLSRTETGKTRRSTQITPSKHRESLHTVSGQLHLSDLQTENERTSIEEAFLRMQKVDDAIQVADALNQSHEVLKKVEQDRLSDICSLSQDNKSLATESLLSVNPLGDSRTLLNKPGHIYSYKIPKSKSNPFSNDVRSGNQRFYEAEGVRRGRTSSVTDYLPSPGELFNRKGRFLKSGTSTRGAHYRSRSMSPHSLFDKGDNGGRKPPSWIRDLDNTLTSEVTDICGQKAPSWIEDIVGSTSSSIQLDQLGQFSIDGSVTSGYSDPTFSSTNPSLQLIHLPHSKVKGLKHTSTPLKKELPQSETDTNCQEKNFESLKGKTHLLNDPNNGKIQDMLKQLNSISEQLKKSSENTESCLKGCNSGESSVNKTESPRKLKEGTCQYLNTSGTLTTLSSITKDPLLVHKTLTQSEKSNFGSEFTTGIRQLHHPWDTQSDKSEHASNITCGSNEEDKPIGGVITDFINDCLTSEEQTQNLPSSHQTLTGGSQPGSMEALKNMLFKLQGEASSVDPADQSHLRSGKQTNKGNFAVNHSLQGIKGEPGGECLERALVHLSRLKTLVQSDTFNPVCKTK